MKTTIEKIENSRAHLEIEVPVEMLEDAMSKAAKKVAKKVNVPGFRKGKAPRAVVERHVGKAALVDEALQDLFPVVYEKAIEETGIKPVGQPEVKDLKVDEDQPMILMIEVDVLPEVKLGDYKSIAAAKEIKAITDEDVVAELDKMRERYAEVKSIEDENIEALEGHFLLVDFDGYVDGEAIQGGSGEGYTLELGSNTFIPGFEEQLVGSRVGEEREIAVTFPQEYHEPSLAGKEAIFKIKVHEIKEKVMPELNDEFATMVEKESFEVLKEETRAHLIEHAEKEARAQLYNQVVELVVEQAEVDVPESMIKQRQEALLQDLDQNLQQQGMGLDMYLQAIGKERDDVLADFAPRAEKEVKTDLVLETIAKQEEISATDEEVSAEIDQIAASYGESAEMIKEYLSSPEYKGRIQDSIMFRKVVEMLATQAESNAAN